MVVLNTFIQDGQSSSGMSQPTLSSSRRVVESAMYRCHRRDHVSTPGTRPYRIKSSRTRVRRMLEKEKAAIEEKANERVSSGEKIPIAQPKKKSRHRRCSKVREAALDEDSRTIKTPPVLTENDKESLRRQSF